MSRISLTSPILRRAVAAVGVASLALLAGTSSASAATASVDKKPTIDTYSDWDGTSYLQPFGNPQTSNYGQTITVPDGKDALKKFTFYMAPNAGTGTLTYRAFVYGWDGTKATDEVFSSKKKKWDTDIAEPGAKPVKIKTKGTELVEGQQYVIFLSVDKDYEDNTPGVLTQWAIDFTDVLPGGNTVWLNSDGDEGQWDTVAWSSVPDWDMAMTAFLK